MTSRIKQQRFFYAAGFGLALSACSEFTSQPSAELLASQEALAQCQSDYRTVTLALQQNHDSLTSVVQQNHESLTSLGNELQALHNSLLEACGALPPPAAVSAMSVAASGPSEPPNKLVVGRLERIWVEDLQLALPARIDTGAETASLDARNIRSFERDGDPWVRFEIPHPRGEEPLQLERPLVREALVIQASSDEPERRPVIELGIQLGPVRQLAEFTLSDRSHLDFQMLVGRNILRDVMLVDVSEANLVALPEQPTVPAANPDPENSERP